MDLLMHICCANCALYPVEALRADGIGLTGLWFNPNIHPEDEYARRMGAVEQFQQRRGLRMEYAGDYGLEEFQAAVATHSGDRCEVCYRMRMRETARWAAAGGYDGFTTSLLVSPYQKHELLRDAAEEASRESGVPFYYVDFRPGWREGQRMSREMGFYRQYYCGCIYSKQERDAQRAAQRKAKAHAGGH
jgi:predicted adenine nucleotide alpha hydrolase (AANH) superfamily ATPase